MISTTNCGIIHRFVDDVGLSEILKVQDRGFWPKLLGAKTHKSFKTQYGEEAAERSRKTVTQAAHRDKIATGASNWTDR
jgi:hypothetical protein